MAHPIHKHMHTHITRDNVKAAIKDDKAHIDYLKRDVLDDQKFHAKDKDEKQTADEKHISKLAGDIKHDEKKEGVSRKSSPANQNVMEEDVIQKDATESNEGGFGTATEDAKTVIDFEKTLSPVDLRKSSRSKMKKVKQL